MGNPSQHELELRALVDNAPGIIAKLDRQFRHVYISRAVERLTGIPISCIIGRTHREVGLPDEACTLIEEKLREVFEREEEATVEFELDLPQGRCCHFARLVPVIGEEGRVDAVLAVAYDVTERHRAEAELSRAKEEAEAANAAKDRFLAMLSHELRAPLTPALAAAQLMENDPELPARFRECAHLVRRNTQMQARLVEDLLDLTRIAHGKLELRLQPTDVHRILGSVVEACGGEAKARGQGLVFEPNALSHHAMVDEARIEQVAYNLVRNAMKFTPTGGSITIATSCPSGDRLCVTVRDTGVGISPDCLERIFEPFDQGGSGAAAPLGGLGLGLSISRRLAELHGGTLRAHSKGRGCGSTFILEVPACLAPAESLPEIADCPKVDPLRILLVEDHIDSARTTALLLRGLGHEVTVAHSRAAAIRLAGEQDFDLAICDIGLPDGSGLDLPKVLRRSHPIRAIALSGYGMPQDVQRSREAGFDNHLTKPIDMRRLEQAVRGQPCE